MDFKELRYVLSVEEHGSIWKAAKSLGISQPSLSRYLQNLNKSMNTQLFKREGSRLVPTYAGERYIAWARHILDVASAFKGKTPQETPFFTVGCSQSEGSYVHPFAIKQFCERHPESRLMMVETSDVSSMLASGQIDVAIVNQPVHGENLVCNLLTQDEILLATSCEHPVINHAIWREGCRYLWVDINRLRNDNFILHFPDQRTRQLSDQLLEEEGIRVKVIMQTRNSLNAIQTAATGAGVCFAPEAAMHSIKFPEPPVFFSVGNPIKMDVFYVYSKNCEQIELVHYFIELVKAFLH